jgi:CCR4-NOT transcription complex subunit 7/8
MDNVDLLKIIQLGITFTDEQGNFIEGCPCFEFNFKFNLKEDMYAQDSIDLLMRSGIDFEALSTRGIDVEHFGELLISSGLVLTDDVHWISFSGGYDFGYLLKLVSCVPLPADEREFFKLFRLYFPNVYDTKHMMAQFDFKGGLNKLAETLSVPRVGRTHTAGSDSFLTAMSFFKMKQIYFKDKDVDDHRGVLSGLRRYEATPDAES